MIVIAPPIKGFNDYEVRDKTTAIFLYKTNGEKFETLIDTEDLERIKELGLHWHLRYAPKTKSYYAKATGNKYNHSNKSNIYLHMIIMCSDFNKKQYVNHKNHNTLDNRKNNLEIDTNRGNSQKRIKPNSNNKSGNRNVCWILGQWWVQMQINGKNKVLGKFDDVHEAGIFAKEMRNKYYKK